MPEPDESQSSTPSARLQHHETNTLKHLTFGILPLKSQVPAAAGTLQFKYPLWDNVSFSDEKDKHSMG
jgi:hypothetical protein